MFSAVNTHIDEQDSIAHMEIHIQAAYLNLLLQVAYCGLHKSSFLEVVRE